MGFDKFGNNDILTFISSSFTPFKRAVNQTSIYSELELLTRRPQFTCEKMPITDSNVTTDVATMVLFVDYWLSWVIGGEIQHTAGAL